MLPIQRRRRMMGEQIECCFASGGIDREALVKGGEKSASKSWPFEQGEIFDRPRKAAKVEEPSTMM